MLHHVTLWVPDLARAQQSWSWLLGELGYARDGSLDSVLLFRHPGGVAIALEQSADMVPGMLYSRLRPGQKVNPTREVLRVTEAAGDSPASQSNPTR